MTVEQAYDEIVRQQSPVVHLSGKTSTGKSTFAHRLADSLGYEVVELDAMVYDGVIDGLGIGRSSGQSVFHEVYKGRDRLDWIEHFLAYTKSYVQQHFPANTKIVLDGALAHPDTVRDFLVLFPGAKMYFFHPANLPVYERYLTERFMKTSETYRAGLPGEFWAKIDQAAFLAFCQSREITPVLHEAIAAYAAESQQASFARFDSLHGVNPHIRLVTIGPQS